MTLVLAAHGTRQASGVAEVQRLAEAVRAELDGRTVAVGFVDVLGPTPAELLREVDGPAVVVPAFLASGYHVRSDVPREVAESGHDDVAVTRALGPDPLLARVGHERLREAGWRDTDTVVLAAAGSSDAQALAQVQCAACMRGIQLDRPPVPVGYVTTASPRAVPVGWCWRRTCWRRGCSTPGWRRPAPTRLRPRWVCTPSWSRSSLPATSPRGNPP